MESRKRKREHENTLPDKLHGVYEYASELINCDRITTASDIEKLTKMSTFLIHVMGTSDAVSDKRISDGRLTKAGMIFSIYLMCTYVLTLKKRRNPGLIHEMEIRMDVMEAEFKKLCTDTSYGEDTMEAWKVRLDEYSYLCAHYFVRNWPEEALQTDANTRRAQKLAEHQPVPDSKMEIDLSKTESVKNLVKTLRNAVSDDYAKIIDATNRFKTVRDEFINRAARIFGWLQSQFALLHKLHKLQGDLSCVYLKNRKFKSLEKWIIHETRVSSADELSDMLRDLLYGHNMPMNARALLSERVQSVAIAKCHITDIATHTISLNLLNNIHESILAPATLILNEDHEFRDFYILALFIHVMRTRYDDTFYMRSVYMNNSIIEFCHSPKHASNCVILTLLGKLYVYLRVAGKNTLYCASSFADCILIWFELVMTYRLYKEPNDSITTSHRRDFLKDMLEHFS